MPLKKYFHNLLLNILRRSFLEATNGVFVREVASWPDQAYLPSSLLTRAPALLPRETVFFWGLKWVPKGQSQQATPLLRQGDPPHCSQELSQCYSCQGWRQVVLSSQAGPLRASRQLKRLSTSLFPRLAQGCTFYRQGRRKPRPETGNVDSHVSQPRDEMLAKPRDLSKKYTSRLPPKDSNTLSSHTENTQSQCSIIFVMLI